MATTSYGAAADLLAPEHVTRWREPADAAEALSDGQWYSPPPRHRGRDHHPGPRRVMFDDYAGASSRWSEPAHPEVHGYPCECCAGASTHAGLAGPDALILVTGCEWLVRQWVRDPEVADRLRRLREAG